MFKEGYYIRSIIYMTFNLLIEFICQKDSYLPLSESYFLYEICRPGMNQCGFSEEETTNALRARYLVPAVPEGNICSNLSGVVPGVANARQSEQNHRHYDFHAVPGGGKKKHGGKERPITTLKGDAPQLSNSKKNEGTMKSRSLDDVNQLPIGDEANFRHLNKAGDMPVEKHRHKHKEKQESVDILSDGGTGFFILFIAEFCCSTYLTFGISLLDK